MVVPLTVRRPFTAKFMFFFAVGGGGSERRGDLSDGDFNDVTRRVHRGGAARVGSAVVIFPGSSLVLAEPIPSVPIG